MSEENRGRPSKTEQIQIQNLLRPYFERNISATFTANSTDINIKTVCVYFNRWAEEIINSKKENRSERCRAERERTLLSYDNLISKEYSRLNETENKINKLEEEGKEVPLNLIKYRHDLVKSVSTLIEKKGRFALPPSSAMSAIGY